MKNTSPKKIESALKIGGVFKSMKTGIMTGTQRKASKQEVLDYLVKNNKISSRLEDNLSDARSSIDAINQSEENIAEIAERQKKYNERSKSVPVPSFVKRTFGVFENVLKKPMQALQKLLLGVLIVNLPKIVQSLKRFLFKANTLYKMMLTSFNLVKDLITNSLDVFKAILVNNLSFDFFDNSNRLRSSIKQLESDFTGDLDRLDDLRKDWQLEGKELDNLIADLDGSGSQGNPQVQPQETITGRPRSGNTNASGGSIFDIIASGEGDYNSVNRGNAGDTPGGARSIFGRDLTDMTVGEVVAAQQRDEVFAVGRYQIIPTTMQDFIRNSDVKLTDKFDEITQEKFKQYVIDVKRPEVGRYLRGESDDRTAAAQGLAREFASVGAARPESIPGFAPAQRGDTLYGGQGNNRASIDPAEIEAALDRDRAATMSGSNRQQPVPANNNSGTIASAGNTTNTDALRKGDYVSGFQVTSAYGPRWGSTHKGVDVATPVGTYVAFTAPCEVIATGSYGNYGYLVDVWVPSLGVQYRLAHLSEILVRGGQQIPAGVPVGRTGGAKGHPGSGRSTGPHLHFEVDTKKGSTNYGGSNSPADLAKYAQFLILSSSPPSARMTGKLSLSKMNNISGDSLMNSPLYYDHEAAEANNNIIVVNRPSIIAKNTVVTQTQTRTQQVPVPVVMGGSSSQAFNDLMMASR